MLRRLRGVLAPVLASLVLFAACSTDDGKVTAGGVASTTSPAAGGSTTAAPAPVTAYAVGTREETYVDESRPTKPNGSFEGAAERTIRTRFYYPAQGAADDEAILEGAEPAEGGPFPVILFSHGWTAVPEVYQRLIAVWAAHGYVVVAPAYPLSNGEAPGELPSPVDVVNQPADASFILDEVLAASAGTDSWMSGLLDPERIGAGGHSLGGITTFGLVYNTCCTDPRIIAGMPMSGAAVAFRDGNFFEGTETPLLLVHGDSDELVPYVSSTNAYRDANPPKFLLTLIGGKHSDDELGGDHDAAVSVAQSALAFFDVYVKGDETALDRLREAGNVAGVATLDETVG